MKKIVCIVALCALSLAHAYAQKPFRVGVTGGMNVSKPADEDEFKTNVGFNVGVVGEFRLSEKEKTSIYLSTSLLLSSKGTKSSDDSDDDYYRYTINAYSVELPVHFDFKGHINRDLSILIGTGPYFGYGLFGNIKVKNDYGSGSLGTFKSEGALKRFDFGWSSRAGIELYKCYQILAGYDGGFLNLSRIGGTYRNSCFSFSVACMF